MHPPANYLDNVFILVNQFSVSVSINIDFKRQLNPISVYINQNGLL